jgi:hypothetical protein
MLLGSCTEALKNLLSRYDFTLMRVLCYALIIFGCVYRIVYISSYNPTDHIFSDPQRHWEQGVDVLRADPMTMTDPVLYQLYIAALAKLTLNDPPLIAFYTILISCLTPWIWYRFMREMNLGKNTAMAGWALLSINPSWIGIYGYFMQETLLLPLLGASLWSSWRCRRKRTVSSFTMMVVLWAMAGLTRSIAVPLAAVAVIWLWILQDKKFLKACCSLLILGVLLGPLTFRGYAFANVFAPCGMGHMNTLYSISGSRSISVNFKRQGAWWYYIFQSPAVEAKPFAPFSDWQSRREGETTVSVDLDRGSGDWERAFSRYPLSLSKYVKLTADNLILLFFSESWPNSNRERSIGEINYQIRWLWAPLTLVVFIATLAGRKRLPDGWMLPAMLLAWLIVQGLMPIAVNEGRYRMPFTGLVIVQALALLDAARKKPAGPRAIQFGTF